MKSFIILFAILLFKPCSGISQVNGNLSFERSYSPLYIKNWRFPKSVNYDFALDSNIGGERSKCLSIKSLVNRQSNNAATFYNISRVPVNLLTGKKELLIVAKILVDSITESHTAAIWANSGSSSLKPNYANSIDQNVGTSWTKVSIKLPIDSSVSSIGFGGFYQGKGKAWFDNFELFLDNQKLTDLMATPQLMTQNEFNELENSVHQIKNLHDSNEFLNNKLKQNLTSAKVIALGEATHGTSEFTEIRKQFISLLSKRLHQDIILALENSFGSTVNLNSYVTGGKGDVREILKDNFFSFWNTEEMVSLINLVKEHNVYNKNKILFYGIDMQSYQDLLAIIEQNTLPLKNRNEIIEHLSFFRQFWENNPTQFIEKDIMKIHLTSLLNLITDDSKDFKYTIRILNVLEQYNNNLKNRRAGPKMNPLFRDECMAENVLWIKDNSPEKKIIVLAHNGHISKEKGRLGNLLNESIKTEYLNIGLTTNNGTFRSYNERGISSISELQKSYPETYEYWFSNINSDTFFLWLDDPNLSKNQWLADSHDLLGLGYSSRQEQHFHETRLMNYYNYIFFVKTTKATTELNQ